MDINEFNSKIVKAGKRMFGDEYSFSASHVQSTLFGHIDAKEITYRAVVFYGTRNGNISAESKDIDLVFEMLEIEYKNLNAIQSSIEL